MTKVHQRVTYFNPSLKAGRDMARRVRISHNIWALALNFIILLGQW